MTAFVDGVPIADGGFYINLDDRTDRRDRCLRQFEKYRMGGFIRFPGIRCGEYAGCGLAHREIIRHASENGLESVVILEDDFHIAAECPFGLTTEGSVPFRVLLREVFAELARVPYDCFYFGGNLLGPLIPITRRVAGLTCAKANHAIIVRKSLYGELLKWSYEQYDAMDHYHATVLQRKHNYVISVPMLINQGDAGGDYSDLLRRVVAYHDWFLSTYDEFAAEHYQRWRQL